MANHIYYAVQNLQVTPEPDPAASCSLSGTGICSQGMISAGFSTSAEYTPVFELGRLAMYDIVDGVTAVEVTVERYLGANGQTLWGTVTGNSLASAISVRPKVDLVAVDDTQLACPGAPTPVAFLRATGLYITNFSVNYPLDGAATETMQFTGTHMDASANTFADAIKDGTSLAAYSDDGSQVVTRVDLTGGYQSVTANVSIGREDLFQFGSVAAFHKAPTFPVESTMTFESLAVGGTAGPAAAGGAASLQSFDRVSISSAFLTSSEYTGGSATGGNATITYTYTGYNDFSCTN